MTMRYVAATAVLASMAIHLILWFQFMHEDRVLGPAFMVNVVAGVLIAYLLVRWQHWLPGVLSACFGMATLGAFTLAATVGLFGTHEHWTGFYVWGAAIAEVTAVLAGFAVVLEEPAPVTHQHRGERRRSGSAQSAATTSSGPAA